MAAPLGWAGCDLVARIHGLVASAEAGNYGTMSTGEMCACALVLDRADIAPAGYTFLECVDRLDAAWLSATILVMRDRR